MGRGPARRFREVRGLWVVRWTMTSEEQVRQMVDRAARAGFNTLLVQVRGRGDAFYRSELEPRAEALEGPPGFDPLELAIQEAHARGMAVHAWINTHLVWGPAAPPQSPEHLVNAHPDWLAVPRGLADELYDMSPWDVRYVARLRDWAAARPETVEGLYTSPSHPEVRARVRAVWLDLLARYDLDGLHLDYIRYPSPEFDYSRGALERFRAWAGGRVSPAEARAADEAARSDPLAWTDAFPELWDEHRREQITSLVRELYEEAKARRPEIVVSAAVVADPESAYALRFQDWPVWLREGVLDVAVPMAYTPDDERFLTLVRTARAVAGAGYRLWAGIGAYLDTLEGTLAKIDLARSEQAGGVVVFSYDWAAGEGRGSEADPFLQRLGRARFQPY
ncbi:MAG TPA: family 10 glycosylhydrolase [Longimicrobiales bacterium]|nr:family 10 glycosylhydrolase [Longimicrobiales bacterium]